MKSRKQVSSSRLWQQDYVQETCPICRLDDGFHDHHGVEVPREVLKEKDWHKERCDPEKGTHSTPHRGCILR